jgi:hypothetical protein
MSKRSEPFDLFRDFGEQIKEWDKIFPHGGGIEVIDTEPIYCRLNYVSGRTTELSFFNEPFRHLSDGNMWIAGCLPNPQAFVVEKVQIEGVTSQLRAGMCGSPRL